MKPKMNGTLSLTSVFLEAKVFSSAKRFAEEHVRFWVTVTNHPLEEAQGVVLAITTRDNFTTAGGRRVASASINGGNIHASSEELKDI